MTGDKEVRAQIKLSFQSCNNMPMLCTRSMQLIAKKTTSTFKTLEGQLQVINQGHKTVVSTKVAELDAQVPLNLGVSQSVLDYVIFCHQEDSLWPLSEPASLKKRFDEIFEALKFTKSLESIKNIRKKAAVDIKLLDQSVKHLEVDKNRAQTQKERKGQLQESISKYQDEFDTIEMQIASVNRKLSELVTKNQAVKDAHNHMKTLENSKESIESQISRLEAVVKLLPDTDEELGSKAANHHIEMARTREKIDAFRKKAEKINSKLAVKRAEYKKYVSKEGELKGLSKKNDENYLELSRLKEIHLDDGDSQDVLKVLGDQQSSSKHQLELLSVSRESQIAEHGKKIEEITSSISNQENLKIYTVEDMTKLEKENESMRSKISSLYTDESIIEYEKAQLESLEKKLSQLKSANSGDELSTKIKENETLLAAKEQEIEEINKQIAAISKRADIYAKIGLIKDDIDSKTKALNAMLSKNSRFEKVFGTKLTANSGSIYHEKSEAQNKFVEEIETENQKAIKLHDSVQYAIDHAETTLKTKKEKLASVETAIRKVLPEEVPSEEYEAYLQELEDDYQDIQVNKSAKDFNNKAADIANDKHYCLLCQRGLSDNELHEFVARLKDLVKKLDSGEFEEIEKELKAARQIGASVSESKELKKEISEISGRLTTLQSEITDLVIAKEANSEKLRQATKKKLEIEAFERVVGEVQRVSKEITHHEEQLKMLEESEDLESGGKSGEELQEAQYEAHAQTKKLRMVGRSLTEQKESRARELSRLEGAMKDKRLAVVEMERGAMERESLLKRVSENESKIEEMSEVVNAAESKVSQLTKYREACEKEKKKYEEESKKEYVKKEKEWMEVKGTFDNVERLVNEIERFEQGAKVELQQIAKAIEELDIEIEEIERETEKRNELIDELRQNLADSDKIEKQIEENLLLRDLQKQLEKIEREIEEIREDNLMMEQEHDYETEYNELNGELTEAQMQRGRLLGEISQMEQQIESIDKELNSDYKNVEKLYKDEWVRLQVQKIVDDDLAAYSKSLDTGIMKYHSAKMEEINKIIDELWHATYRGTDVDTIRIRSDVNLKSKGNRTYNYRVVMQKSDTELDMRGRCSAGQKVLASIIIRLALAESFGVNCGMIALDEPTTNLDIENSEGLAQALGRLIEMRRNQKNFQLIVITHDEKFLNHMDAQRYTDHFYRVSRNERQMSRIESVDISRVGGE